MHRKHNYNQLGCAKSNTSTPNKKSKTKSSRSSKEPKLVSHHKLSEAFYSKENMSSVAKILFLDQFEAD